MGNSPIRTRMGKGDESRSVYAYSGFRLLRDEEINKDKQETFGTVQDSPKNIFGAFHAQSSKSSILSLLKITQRTTNYKLLEAKIIELLELYDYSRGDKS
jgi:hypothetical protein